MISNAFGGLRHLGSGISFVMRAPKLAVLGMIPPLIVSVLLMVALVSLGFGLAPITATLTSWVPDSWQGLLQVVLGVVIMLVAVVLAVIVFSSLALIIGAPIYEKISEAAEAACGGVTDLHDEKLSASVARSIVQSIALLGLSLLLAIPVFLLGLVPAVGGLLGAIAGALVGGTMITIELIGGPFDRRGRRRLGEKFGAGRGRRARLLGFGIPVFLLFSVPLVAVVLFPAATAGGTFLARELAGERVIAPTPTR